MIRKVRIISLILTGASLIAIHARYRVNLVGRTGPGARDGAAHLDQVWKISKFNNTFIRLRK